MKAIAVIPGRPNSVHLAELPKLLTHSVKGLENWSELFDKLTSVKGAIKVFCEVAAL